MVLEKFSVNDNKTVYSISDDIIAQVDVLYRGPKVRKLD